MIPDPGVFDVSDIFDFTPVAFLSDLSFARDPLHGYLQLASTVGFGPSEKRFEGEEDDLEAMVR